MLFVWNNAIVAILAFRLASRAVGPGPARAVATGVLYCGICIAALVLAGTIGQVHQICVAIIVTVALGAEYLLLGELPQHAPVRVRRVELAALGGLALVAATWGSLATQGAVFAWDDLTYHAAVPGHWLQTGTLSLPAFTYQAYYPLNTELLSLWFILPGSDAHIRLGVAVWAGLVAASGVAIGTAGRHSMVGGAAAMMVFLATPKVWEIAQSTSASDLAIAALGMAALALAWSPTDRSPVSSAAVCGVASGLAVGAKVSMAPLVAILAVWWALESRRIGHLRPLGVFAAAVVALGGGWYLRNLLQTGNPLFPAAIGPFAGPMDAAAQWQTSLLGIVQRPERYPNALSRIFTSRLDWPLPLGMLSVVGYASAGVAVARKWTVERRYATWLICIIFAGVSFVLLFVLAPYSGTTNQPDYALHKMVRYLTFPFALGLALVPAALPALNGERLTLPRINGWAATAILIAIVAVVGFREPAKSAATTQTLHNWGGKKRPIGHAWRALEDLPDGSQIATLTAMPGSHAFLYPLFGRRFQHTPIAVLPNGQTRGHLHRQWRQRDGWWWEFRHQPATDHLAANLRQAGVDYVLVSKWSKAKWPPQRRALQNQLGDGAIVYRDRYSEIWKVAP